MKIIYAYELDAADINVQSGRPFSILAELERRGNEVVRVFPLARELRYLHEWKKYYYRSRGVVYRSDREPTYLRSLAAQVDRRVRSVRADVLVAPGSHVIAELRSPHPKVLVADATFANVLGFYDSFTHCAPKFVSQGHDQERKALANCAAAIFPSTWAACSAVEAYGADPAKVHVIPFGGNLMPADQTAVPSWIERRSFELLRLLFIGRDWYRKGGPTVLAVCDILQRQGVSLRLDMVGVDHLAGALPAYAHVHGRLDKRDPVQRQKLETLLGQAHLLFVPSLAENYGMVFCEAAAFGVPSLATAVGGIPAAVRQGSTGYLLPAGSPPEDFATILLELYGDPSRYRQLAFAALEDARARLSWEAFGHELLRVLRGVLDPAERASPSAAPSEVGRGHEAVP